MANGLWIKWCQCAPIWYYFYYSHLLLTVCWLISSSAIGSSTICCPFCKKRFRKWKQILTPSTEINILEIGCHSMLLYSPLHILQKKVIGSKHGKLPIQAHNATLALILMYSQPGWSHSKEYVKPSGIWSLTTTQLDIIFHYYNFSKTVKPDEDRMAKSHTRRTDKRVLSEDTTLNSKSALIPP